VLAARHALLRTLTELAGPNGLDTFDLPGRARSAQVTGLSGAAHVGVARSPAVPIRPESIQLVDAQSAVIRLDDGRDVLVQVVARLERGADLPVEHRAVIQVVASPQVLAELAGHGPEELRARLRLLMAEGVWCRHWDDDALDARAVSAAREGASLHLDWLDDFGEEKGIVSAESRLHLAVKQIIKEAGEMQVPALEVRVERHAGTEWQWVRSWATEPWRAIFTDVRLEYHLGCGVPDVLAEGPDGRICVEVTVTNPIDSAREERYSSQGIAALEIDLRVFSGRVTRDQLRRVVIDELVGKRWIYHPLQASQRKMLLDAYESEVGTLRRLLQSDLVSEARDRALSYYDSGFDAEAEENLLHVLCELERRGVRGVTEREFYGHAGLLPRLMSIALGRPVGYRVETVFQVVNAIAQSRSPQWAPLILLALKVYAPRMTHQHDEWIARWRKEIVRLVRARDPSVALPKDWHGAIRAFFPELADGIERLPASERRGAIPPSLVWQGESAIVASAPASHEDAALSRASGAASRAGQTPWEFARVYAMKTKESPADVMTKLRSLGLTNGAGYWS